MSVIGPRTVRPHSSLHVRAWVWMAWTFAFIDTAYDMQYLAMLTALFFAWILWRSDRDNGPMNDWTHRRNNRR